MIFWLWSNIAWGYDLPLDYEIAVIRRKSAELVQISERQSLQQALHEGDVFSKTVLAHPILFYEMGLLCNRHHQLQEALQFYDKALMLDPNLQSALYDRVEILLGQEKFDQAFADLQNLKAQGVSHWLIELRLAEVAAYHGQLDEMETLLLSSIALGMNIQDLPILGWSKWARDSRLQIRLQQIIVTYGGQAQWEQLLR